MRLSTVFLSGFVVLTIALASKTYQLGQELTDGRKADARDLQEATAINRELIDQLHRLRKPPFSFKGIEATSGEEVTLETIDSMVVYLFGPDCPFSSRNVPFLNSLHAAGVRVIGMAPDERRPLIELFARTSETAFPLLASPRGNVIDILPNGAVPLSAVFLNGRMESLWLGELDEDRKREIAERFGLDSEEELGS